MRIITPTDIEEVAWDGYLQPQGEVYRKAASLPRVTLGEPVWWPAEQAMESETGKAWTPPAGDWRYLLVRLACTLHPPREEHSLYTEATLHAYLRAARGPGHVVAQDLYPQRRSAEQKGAFKFSLGSDLRFADAVDLSLMEVGAEIEYRQVFPVIQGFGLGESSPYWQFTRHATFPLLGCQYVYALLAAPAGAGGVRLSVEMVATWETRYGPLRVGLPEEARAHVSRTLAVAQAGPAAEVLAQERPAIDADNPPIAVIRDLLEAAFTVQSLRRFCQDRPAFHPLLNQFSPEHGLDDMVERAIEYCGTLLLWEELLDGVQEASPRQYARFVERLR
jgi:hypothetical protein